MNREIRFRFWNHIVGRMTPISYTLEHLHVETVNFTNLIPLQFTGSLDWINARIFESDILKVHRDGIGSPIPSDFIGEVKFYEGCFWVDNGKMSFPVWQEITEWEIIGNSYETPNLITNQS